MMEFLLFITGIAGGTTAVCQEVALGDDMMMMM